MIAFEESFFEPGVYSTADAKMLPGNAFAVSELMVAALALFGTLHPPEGQFICTFHVYVHHVSNVAENLLYRIAIP